MISFAFCTYNRSDRLEALVNAMRQQHCAEPFEILVINNNSSDDTLAVLERLAAQPGVPLRFVTEPTQGIVPARNRALTEAMASDILIFMDDDELPHPGLVSAAHHAIAVEGAQCAGGAVEVCFAPGQRPSWLGDDLLGFLARVNHGPKAFWIENEQTPVWTANVAYDMRVFRDDPTLRFDKRYDRIGNVIGGGSDAIMFRTMLERKFKIRYRPDMVVDHFVETWRLSRRYFLKLHYLAGIRTARHDDRAFAKTISGIPYFALINMLRLNIKLATNVLAGGQGYMRKAMNVTHAAGLIVGYHRRETAPSSLDGGVQE